MPKKTNIKPIPIQAAGAFRILGGGGVAAATASGDAHSQQMLANSIGRSRFIPKGYPDEQLRVISQHGALRGTQRAINLLSSRGLIPCVEMNATHTMIK